ncbi:MAG: TonB-dependent receptor [Treponema sp.]|nr:TonB-dependent receptor [Treponema sp.]
MKYFLLLFILLPFSLFAQEIPDNEEDDYYFFENMEGITVVGTTETSQQITVIGKDEIIRSSANDLANLLNDTLGLVIVRYGAYGNQAGINLRGFDSKRVAFLIDGIPANSATDGKFDINRIDINSIEKIEVIYGGSDSKFNVSGALGGVINIITARKQEQGLRFGFSVSNTSAVPDSYRSRSGETENFHIEDLLDTQNYTMSAAYGGSAFSLAANIFVNRAGNHFLYTDHYNFTRRKENNEVWDTGASLSLVKDFENFTKLISGSRFYYGGRNFPDSGSSQNFGNQKDISVSQSFMIDSPRAFHDDLAMEGSLSWQFSCRDFLSSGGNASRHDQQGLFAAGRLRWYNTDKLTLNSGFDYRFTRLDSTEIGNRRRHNGGLYLTAEFAPFKRLLVIPSVKGVFTGGGMQGITVIPKLGILWDITESTAFKFNFFRSFKYPDFEELYWSGESGEGNPDLRPEDGWGSDLGIAWRITEFLRFESVFFSQWIKDSIHWFSKETGIWRPENVGQASIFGLDNKITFTLPLTNKPIKKITASLSYQYLLSYLLYYGYTFSSNKRIPYNPEHTINASTEIFWLSGSVTFNSHFESTRYHDTANITALKPVFLLNANINQNIGKDFTVFCALRNILNVSYESFYDYPMPGITLTLGARLNRKLK